MSLQFLSLFMITIMGPTDQYLMSLSEDWNQSSGRPYVVTGPIDPHSQSKR